MLLTLLWAIPALALDHIQEVDSVDCFPGACQIRWYDDSTYHYDNARQHANESWNAVGRVNIAHDTSTTIADLVWSTFCNNEATAYDGKWLWRTGADLIDLNRCKLDGYGDDDRARIATHELGHALRIEDHPNNRDFSDYWRDRAIMYWNPKACTFLRPQDHDRNDYHSVW